MMGKSIHFAMALAAALASTAPAMADTVVQEASNRTPSWFPGIFQGFDYRLGALNNVTLQIWGTETRIFGATYPEGANQPITIDWLIAGNSIFRFYKTNDVYQELVLPIFGSGQVSATEDASWIIAASGDATFTINPSLILDINTNPWNEARVAYTGPGLYDYSDVSFASSAPIQINTHGGSCGAGQGEEACNSYRYRLTYDYTPSVPEPGTWAMALLGFGIVGSFLRGRKARRVGLFQA